MDLSLGADQFSFHVVLRKLRTEWRRMRSELSRAQHELFIAEQRQEQEEQPEG